MRAICVDASRDLQLKDIPAPGAPPPGYVTVAIAAAAINPGDKTFLKLPDAAGGVRGTRLEGVWGSSAAGVVTAIGKGVPERHLGKKVAVYRSLQPDKSFLGVWCETAQLPLLACLPLPDHVDSRDYCGSLVNIVTAYAFLEQAVADGHRAIIVTAGGSATGRALVVLARRRAIPTLVVVREPGARSELETAGAARVLASGEQDFARQLERAARELEATAVFDGVGGALVSQMLAALPPRSSVYFYGFLAGPENVAFPSSLFMMKDLTMRRFSNFDSATVRDEARLAAMLADLETCIDHPMLRTFVGAALEFEQIDEAMRFSGRGKPILLPSR